MKTKKGKSNAYAKSGVNVTLGDQFSSFCGKICRSSYSNSEFVEVHDVSGGHFRGRRGYSLKNLPRGTVETAGSDGIGTKTIVIDAAGSYGTAASNLLAMIGGDMTRDGCMPLIVLNDLGVKSLGKDEDDPTFQAAKQLMLGLERDASDQGYVLLSGETAELSACVTLENPEAVLAFNWSATMIGVMHPDKLITGDNIRDGDRVIALRDVTRSNGLSLIRRGLRKRYGEKWYSSKAGSAMTACREATTPSVLYDKFLVRMNGWTTPDFKPVVKMNLIAHLSGGGIDSKFGQDLLFPRGWSAHLNNLWFPPQVMRDCAEDLKVSDHECYEAWGCGQGALVVVGERDSERFIHLAEREGIEARDAGMIKSTPGGRPPRIVLQSGFTGDSVKFEPKPKKK